MVNIFYYFRQRRKERTDIRVDAVRLYDSCFDFSACSCFPSFEQHSIPALK